MDTEEVQAPGQLTTAPTIKAVRSSNSVSFEATVSSKFKYFHALSTFASRPELLIPHVRSTDLDWESIPEAVREACNEYDSKNLFDFLYSPIYHEGKYSPSNHVGELYGSLARETFTSWSAPDSDLTPVALQRSIHHKPVKDAMFGWTSKNKEIWDFKSGVIEITPIDDKSPVPYVPFPTLRAEFMSESNTCKLTVRPFPGVPEIENEQAVEFYERVVFPKLFEWMSDQYVPGLPKLTRQRARPISHVSNSKYWYFYDLIKSGPAEYIKSIWQESTDPVKFIHEDIGIASYVASLIYDERESKYWPTVRTDSIDILDLGCGNGLLCFFLHEIISKTSRNSEVTGFDIRRRKLWPGLLNKYEQKANESVNLNESTSDSSTAPPGKSVFRLLERSIVPHLMDDLVDQYGCSPTDRTKRSLWLIGNHSDELTPWIPVLARRMNATGFFIIPCCPFDYFQKYQRKANLPGSSTYQNYIEYICTIGDTFGYQPTLENLRIPSTKKICLIGLDCRRKFDHTVLENHVEQLLKRLKDGDEGHSLSKFVPRQKETEKGSQNVSRVVAESIVHKIFQLIVQDCKQIPNGNWYPGREDVTFRDIMTVLTPEERGALKKKGNGLRTIIKSNRYLFTFDNDVVKLKTPQKQDWKTIDDSKRAKIKTKECFFQRFHPQCCPLTEEECAYRH